MVSVFWSKLTAYAELVRLHKPIGIYLLLWPTLWALFIVSSGQPNTTITLVFIIGVILMRSAGCAINDYADRKFDGHVERTKDRPIIAGRVTPTEAVWIFSGLSLIAFILAYLTLNKLTLVYALAAVLLAASYPFTKRYHYLPQVHLGCAFAWAIPMAFVAHSDSHPPLLAWLLFAATLVWTTAYDTIYGIIDRPDDVKIGVKSTAILFADADRLVIAMLQLLCLCLLLTVGTLAELQPAYYLSLMLAAGCFIYQQILIRQHESTACLRAFCNNHYVGMLVLIGIISSYWLPI